MLRSKYANYWQVTESYKAVSKYAGASKVFMSGSGSTLVAMTENEEIARKIVAEFSKRFKTVRKICFSA